MGTEVLRSQDCLKARLRLEAFGSRPPPPHKLYRKKSTGPFYPSSSPSPPSATCTLSPSAATKPPRRNSAARSSPPLQAKPPRRRHRKSPSPSSSSASDGEILPIPRRAPLVMEEIRILRRGEDFKPSSATSSSSCGERWAPDCCGSAVLCSTERIEPEPKILPKKMEFVDLFSSSPAPSSLPIPGFFLKKANHGVFKGDEATRALRIVLRLDDLL